MLRGESEFRLFNAGPNPGANEKTLCLFVLSMVCCAFLLDGIASPESCKVESTLFDVLKRDRKSFD